MSMYIYECASRIFGRKVEIKTLVCLQGEELGGWGEEAGGWGSFFIFTTLWCLWDFESCK